MKQLISSILFISIILISCSSYADTTVVRVNYIYSQPSSTVSSMVLKPSLSNQHIDESFAFTANQTVHKQSNFFELAIIFNEKLQQFISFFTHLGDEVEEVASNIFLSTETSPVNNNGDTIQKCKASSW